MKFWLMKSEPDVYSIDDLKRDQTTWWEGVRNYQARNFMVKEMKCDDLILFYHSNSKPSGVAGIGKISKLAEPDQLQFQKNSEYFDPKATLLKPIWMCVQVSFKSKFKNFISLDTLRQHPSLKNMLVLKKGQRLSIQPVSPLEFEVIENLGISYSSKTVLGVSSESSSKSFSNSVSNKSRDFKK